MPYKDLEIKKRYDKKYKQEHLEQFRLYRKRSYIKHREKEIERQKKYNKKNSKQHLLAVKKWQEKNLDKIKKYNKEYYQKNKEKILTSYTKWRLANMEKRRKSCKAYRKRHPDRIRFKNNIAKDRRRGAKGKHTLQEWEALKKKYNYSCPKCKRKELIIKLTRDHIIPISKGGTNYIDNIQPLCGSCNSRKKDHVH